MAVSLVSYDYDIFVISPRFHNPVKDGPEESAPLSLDLR
jgi:hypothetical protein